MQAKITKSGRLALFDAIRLGTSVAITQFKISSSTNTITGDETNLPTVDYVVPMNKVQVQTTSDQIVFRVVIDDPAIALNIGMIGAFTASDQLFAIASYPGIGPKLAAAPPSVLGNSKILYLIIPVVDAASSISVSASFVSSIFPGNALNSLIVGGTGNSATADGAIVLGGKGAVGNLAGAITTAGGFFTVAGDAQTHDLACIAQALNTATPTNFTFAGGVAPTMSLKSIWQVRVSVIAATTDGLYYDVFKLEKIFKHLTTTSDTGVVVETLSTKPPSLPPGYPDWSIDLSKESTGIVRLRAIGSAGANARFLATMKINALAAPLA